jgi:hypothetical protein
MSGNDRKVNVETTMKCEFYESCKSDKEQLYKERLAHAEFTGKVLTTLTALERSVGDIWGAIQNERQSVNKDVKDLYFKIGLVSGGTSLVVSLVVSLIIKAVST